MAKMDSYPIDNLIENDDKLLGTDSETGETHQYTQEAIAAFVRTFGLNSNFGVFGGMTNNPTDEWVAEAQIDGQPITRTPVRLTLNGEFHDTEFLPAEYGAIFINDEEIPAGSKFDFRNLTRGTRLKFEIEFESKIERQLGAQPYETDLPYAVEFGMRFPGETDTKYIESFAYNGAGDTAETTLYWTNHLITMNHYISDDVTQSLIGGEITWRQASNLDGDNPYLPAAVIILAPDEPVTTIRNVRITVSV